VIDLAAFDALEGKDRPRQRVTVRLPWPAPELSPNARSRTFHKKARFAKVARADAGWLTKAAKVPPVPSEGPIALLVTWHPPTRQKIDDDNMVARFKAARDGIADALGVDDNRFQPTYAWGDPVKGGAVVVTL
jgi:crossover junction endodeoxyribonuclease RusA